MILCDDVLFMKKVLPKMSQVKGYLLLLRPLCHVKAINTRIYEITTHPAMLRQAMQHYNQLCNYTPKGKLYRIINLYTIYMTVITNMRDVMLSC